MCVAGVIIRPAVVFASSPPRRAAGWSVVVSVQPRPWPKPAQVIVAAVRAKYARRQAPLAVQVRDRLGEVFPDAEFESAYAGRGRPGWSPGRLALVSVLQMAEGLTDRQAAEAVRERLSWQYALGLDLDDPGFDHTVLSEFRARVVAHGLEERDRLDACGRRGPGPQPAGVGRGVGARLPGGAGRGRAGVAGWGDRRGRVGPAVRRADRLVAAACLGGQAGGARAGLCP